MYHSLFIHSPTEGHLGCFQSSEMMNKVATNIDKFLSECKFSFLLDKYLGVGLLGHMVRICLTL